MVRLEMMPHIFKDFKAVYCSYDHHIYILAKDPYIPENDLYEQEYAVLGYDIDQDQWNDSKVPNLTDYSENYSACSYGSIIYVFN